MLPLSILNQARRALVEQIQTVRQEREAPVPSRLSAAFTPSALPAGAAAPDAPPHLSVLCRRPEQIPSVLDAGADAVYLDFEDLRDYAAGVKAVRQHADSIPVFLATPRIQKPSETGYFKLMERAEPGRHPHPQPGRGAILPPFPPAPHWGFFPECRQSV